MIQLLVWFLNIQIHLANAKYIQISFYSDYYCSIDYYSVGIKPNTCLQYYDASVKLTCSSSSGLVAYAYTTQDCSGYSTSMTYITTKASSTCSTSGWTTNDYLDFASQSYRIKCSVGDDWAKDNSYLITARTTSVLQKFTAIDYEAESCRDEFCDKKTVMYAYPSSCLSGFGNSRQYYSSYFSNQVIRYDYYDTYCYNYQGYQYINLDVCSSCTTFSETLGFFDDDFWDDDVNDAAVAGWLISVIVFSVIFFCCVVIGVPLFFCGGLTLLMHKYRGSVAPQPSAPESHFNSGQSLPQQIVVATQPQYQMVQSPQMAPQYQIAPSQDLYATPQPQYQAYSPQMDLYATPQPQYQTHSPQMELLTITIPPDAFPGQILMVQKSNGMQVPYQIPPNILPGGVCQVYL